MDQTLLRVPAGRDAFAPRQDADLLLLSGDVPPLDDWSRRSTTSPRSPRRSEEWAPAGQGHGQVIRNRNATGRPGVLVVDNNEAVRSVLAWGLERHGFVVWSAADGWQAFHLYWAHRPDIDLVLLNVSLTSGSGPNTLFALQQLNPAVRFCIMSGDPRPYTKDDLMQLGALAFIPKPVQLDQVVFLLGALLDCPAQAPA